MRLVWYFKFKIWKLENWKRIHFDTFVDKLIHFRKCSCGHPLWCHVCYEHGTCIHGVCLASTFFDEECYCDGFNSMWNEDFSTKDPKRPRITNGDKK